jgi:aspartyl-tRNA(Asn)/glutamyl-tRNA(Gln) amidotransferase subunit A
MDEFGMGSSTEHSCHGATRNPFDLARSPGGSSGGSAAAVAARMVPLALGSDTGGSVRQPAALCGISGIKPTYGRVSRFGLVAYASSLDTVAPLAVDADDLALCLGVLAGVDPHDATSLDVPVPDYAAALGDRGDRGDRGANGTNGTTADGADHADHADLHGLRVGVPREYFDDGLDHDVRTCVQDAIYTLEARGATVVDLSMPHTGYAIPTYYLIATAEASSNLARYDGVRFGARAGGDGDLDEMYRATRSAGFGAEVQRRILLGSYCLRAGYVDDWYIKAQQVRTLIRRDFERAFEQVDVIASPTSPVPAFALGDKLDDPLAMYLNDVLTTPANLAGVPALSIPCGAVPGSGLPIGLQLMAPALGEATLLRVARAFQATTGFHLLEPPL